MTRKIISRIVLCLALAQFVFAQDRGTITGTVGDSTGALIPGAKITLVNTGTEARYETVASATGNYTVTGLPAGVYTVSVEHPGFSAAKQTNVRVQVAVTTRVDIVLQVGQATQTVEVTADSTMLKTESAEQSTTITGDTINNLPINFAIG